MQTINDGYRSVWFLIRLNLDRLLFATCIVAALWASTFIAAL